MRLRGRKAAKSAIMELDTGREHVQNKANHRKNNKKTYSSNSSKDMCVCFSIDHHKEGARSYTKKANIKQITHKGSSPMQSHHSPPPPLPSSPGYRRSTTPPGTHLRASRDTQQRQAQAHQQKRKPMHITPSLRQSYPLIGCWRRRRDLYQKGTSDTQR